MTLRPEYSLGHSEAVIATAATAKAARIHLKKSGLLKAHSFKENGIAHQGLIGRKS
jgi:hypothetical protein